MYSERLGVLDDRQFQAALARLGLGDFVRADPVSGGLFGQNVFVTSTTGAWVLRGAPHYDWQFPAERLSLCKRPCRITAGAATKVPWRCICAHSCYHGSAGASEYRESPVSARSSDRSVCCAKLRVL